MFIPTVSPKRTQELLPTTKTTIPLANQIPFQQDDLECGVTALHRLYALCAFLKLQYFGHLMQRIDSLEKSLMLGGIWGQEEKGMTEDEMAGWHHGLDGREFE